MRNQGRASDAKAVSRVARPKTTVWAINRVARTSPKAVKRLLAAFDALKAAQLRAPEKIATAAAAFREATETVVHDAIEGLKRAGLSTTLDTHRRIANTLRGAAATARGALVDGRLTDEVAPGGFDLFGGTMPRGRRPRLRVVETTPPAPPARDDLARRRAARLEEEAREQARAAASADAAVLDARERLRELEGTARTASRRAAKGRTLAELARRKADKRRRHPPR